MEERLRTLLEYYIMHCLLLSLHALYVLETTACFNALGGISPTAKLKTKHHANQFEHFQNKLTAKLQFLCFSSPASRSRALTTPRSTWVELVMRPSLLPRRLWYWGCLCEMLHCQCHWIRRSIRKWPPAKGLHRLTYTKEGKTLCLNGFYSLLWF